MGLGKTSFKIGVLLFALLLLVSQMGHAKHKPRKHPLLDYYEDLADSGITVPMPYTDVLSTLITYLIDAGLMSAAPEEAKPAKDVHLDGLDPHFDGLDPHFDWI